MKRFTLTLIILLAAARAAGETPEHVRLATPEDRKLSPYTGYTRQHWLEITEKLLAGVLPHLNPANGMPRFPEHPGEPEFVRTQHATPNEAFERIMMLAILYSAATGRDTVPGWEGSITEPFRRGIVVGSDPAHAHYWNPKPREQIGSITAFAIHLSPRFFWEPLTPAERTTVLRFLDSQGRNESFDNNHYFFHMMPLSVLEANGWPTNRARHLPMLGRLFGWYRGDGWFQDGSNGSFDYYNAWGFHLYNQALYRFDPPTRKEYGEKITFALVRFLETYGYFFGRDGGPIPWGRSLAYRFGAVAPYGWAAWNGSGSVPPGQARRIASGTLKYFWEHGAMSADGLMHAGYHGPNGVAGEFYVGSGTPYFAVQGLIALMLPEDHPFWTEPEQAMPADRGEGTVVLPGPEMVVRIKRDGDARLYPVSQRFSRAHQHWQRGVKYQQHAYSSYLGWAALGEGSDLGAGRTGASLDGQHWQYRDHARALKVTADHIASAYGVDINTTYTPAIDDRYEVVTHTLIGESGEIHVIWHQSPQPLHLHLGGYGIAAPTADKVTGTMDAQVIKLQTPGYFSVMRVLSGPSGRLTREVVTPRPGWKHAHLFGGVGAYPVWRSAAPVPANTPVVIYVEGGRDRPPPEPAFRVSHAPEQINLEWDGTSHAVRVPW